MGLEEDVRKEINWSLNPNPVAQATEDAEQFLKAVQAAKTYQNFNVSSIVWEVARASSNDLRSRNSMDYFSRTFRFRP